MHESGDTSEAEGFVNYDYLCVDDADMAKTHTASNTFERPACNSSADNYYVREDLLFDWPDSARLGELAAEHLSNGEALQVRCTDDATYRELLDSFVASGELSSYLSQDGYRYTFSDAMMSIAIFAA